MDLRSELPILELGRAIIRPVVGDQSYRAPVVLSSAEIGCIYGVLERHVRPNYLQGPEKFFKIVRADMLLDTWRPRVHGTQLKALLNARLPETDEEFSAVEAAFGIVRFALRAGSTPASAVEDVRKFVTHVSEWWDNRNRRLDGSLKRPMSAPPTRQGLKRIAAGHFSSGDQSYPGLLPLNVLAGLAEAAVGSYRGAGELFPRGDVPPQHCSDRQLHGKPSKCDIGQLGGSHQPGSLPAASRDDPHVQLTPKAEQEDHQPATTRYINAAAWQYMERCTPAQVPSYPLVSLNVGGTPYTTLAATLLSAPQGSLLWRLASSHTPEELVPLTAGGELFLDRDGKLFAYVLEFLRSCSSNEAAFPLPDTTRGRQALAREAKYFKLTALSAHLQQALLTCPDAGTGGSPLGPQPVIAPATAAAAAAIPASSQCFLYDSLYLETGFSSIAPGPGLAAMEQRKVQVMSQMNTVLARKYAEGFVVETCGCGAHYREETARLGAQRNLYYHVLLKKPLSGEVPLPAGAAAATPAAVA